MAKPHLYRTEAIVLRRSDFGEADRLISLITPYLGKVRAIAKGVRRPTSRMAGHLELFTHSKLFLAKGRNLDIITQAETIEAFVKLRSSLSLTSLAYYLAELVDKSTEEHLESFPLYSLHLWALGRLAEVRNPEPLVRYFEVQLLELLGYRPQLESCTRCNAPLKPVQNAFSAAGGGALCPDCRWRDDRSLPLSVEVLKVLRAFQRGDNNLPGRLILSEESNRQVAAVTQAHLSYVLEGQLRSTAFIATVKQRLDSRTTGEGMAVPLAPEPGDDTLSH